MLSLLLAKIVPYLAGLLALLAALGGVIFSAKRAGVKQQQAAETEKALEQSKESNAINQDVRNLPQSELDKRLRSDQRD